jgi:cation transporter-like permease
MTPRPPIDPIRPIPDWRQRRAPAWFVGLLIASVVVAAAVIVIAAFGWPHNATGVCGFAGIAVMAGLVLSIVAFAVALFVVLRGIWSNDP